MTDEWHYTLNGGLTTVILAMLWLYFCMYIVFIGALLNKFCPDWFRWAYAKMTQSRKQAKPPETRENGTDSHNSLQPGSE